MSEEMNQEWVIGLDAGGTRTRAVLAAADDGRPLGEGAAGPGNALTVPEPHLADHLAEALARAVPEAARGRVVAVAGGFAGATAASADDPGTVRARAALDAALRRLGIPAERVVVFSDIEAAFAAAPGTPADGLALVAGTGAVAMRITGRRSTTTVDGDGWLLGDDGSGFWMGRAAVRSALRMADGRGPATSLAASVGRALGLPDHVLPYEGQPGGVDAAPGHSRPDATPGHGGAPALHDLGRSHGAEPARPHPDTPGAWSGPHREAYRMHLLPAVMADPPIRLARFAPLVAEAAREGDAVAGAILTRAADRLAETVRALEPRPGEPLVATGGLLGPDGPLTALLADRLAPLGLTLGWVADGSRGAVALARLAHGGAR
ncbi:N-acetylglucosamine kinase [Streptomyces sp. YU58]|uniref:N-acetylglucosamine kinase n=1 Tax=Streptomyces sp. SX92 TaxID=3158972 RepID=UPI0027B9F993|nr:BadF/BadG/BcrA/BcrD ATPase family protein [Streptomyces coralus]WLW51496.1 BadF/BadG/BcrA/BcrD ATPase family protein [Streptomyces coralus]